MTESDEIEPLPCPFCKSLRITVQEDTGKMRCGIEGLILFAYCHCCGCHGPYHWKASKENDDTFEYEYCVKNWNNRS